MLWLNYHPFGSRSLSLCQKMGQGSDIWLLQRWLNRAGTLRPAWALPCLLENGFLSSKLFLGLKALAKNLTVWQPWQIGDLSYLIFGQESGRYVCDGLPFGARLLMPGDTGNDVQILQNRLVGSNRRLGLILGRPPDGCYDRRTERMVRVFQRESLPKSSLLRASGCATSTTLLAVWDRTVLGGRNLRRGDRGLDVLALQGLLNSLGFSTPLSGVFDHPTSLCLAGWQRKKGLRPSGSFQSEDCWRLGLERGY